MDSVLGFRKKAAQCRRIAGDILRENEPVRRALLEMAAELEGKAAALDTNGLLHAMTLLAAPDSRDHSRATPHLHRREVSKPGCSHHLRLLIGTALEIIGPLDVAISTNPVKTIVCHHIFPPRSRFRNATGAQNITGLF
jgi:hypothetical protein